MQRLLFCAEPSLSASLQSFPWAGIDTRSACSYDRPTIKLNLNFRNCFERRLGVSFQMGKTEQEATGRSSGHGPLGCCTQCLCWVIFGFFAKAFHGKVFHPGFFVVVGVARATRVQHFDKTKQKSGAHRTSFNHQ